jgi:hypothetical protein
VQVLPLEWPPCDGQRDQANGARERTQRTVALDQSALLEVLDALKTAQVDRLKGAESLLRRQAVELRALRRLGVQRPALAGRRVHRQD